MGSTEVLLGLAESRRHENVQTANVRFVAKLAYSHESSEHALDVSLPVHKGRQRVICVHSDVPTPTVFLDETAVRWLANGSKTCRLLVLVDRDHVSLKVMEWRGTRVVNMWSENTAENRLSLAGVPIERCDAVLLKFHRLKLITTTRACVSNETVEFDVALNPAGRVPDIQGIIEKPAPWRPRSA